MPTIAFVGRVGLLCALVACALVVPSRADETCAPTLVSTFGIGEPNDVLIVGDYAYVGGVGYGLTVLDVSEPLAPVVVGQLSDSLAPRGRFDSEFNNPLRRLAAVGDMVFVADDGRGVQIVGVADPTAPERLAIISQPGPKAPGLLARDVAVSGTTLCVANNRSLMLADVSDPRAPKVFPLFELPFEAITVSMRGDLAIVAGRRLGNEDPFWCIDVSDPSQPKVLGTSELFGRAIEVEVEGDLAYVAVDRASARVVMLVVDVSDPTNPTIVGFARGPDTFVGGNDVSLDGSLAYVADGWLDRVMVFDVSEPSAPVLAGVVETGRVTRGVGARDGVAYAATEYDGLQVIDAVAPENPRVVERLDRPALVNSVMGVGGYIYAFDFGSSERLSIVDVRDPGSPVSLGEAGLGCVVAPGQALEGTSFIALPAFCPGDGRSKLLIVDVAEPASPFVVGEAVLEPAGAPHDVWIDGDLACVVMGDSSGARVFFVDVRSPTAPVVVGSSLRVSEEPSYIEVAVSGDTLLVSTTDDVRIFDISDLDRPDGVGRYRRYWRNRGGMAVRGDVAFIAERGFVDLQPGVHVVDVSDPSEPSQISYIELAGFPGDFRRRGDVLVVPVVGQPTGTDSLVFFDVRDVSNPRVIGTIPALPRADGAAFDGGMVYLAMLETGVGVVDAGGCIEPCPGDWDGNGVVNAGDVGAFLSAYFLDLLNGTMVADFNGDGVTNAADVGAYLSEYFPNQGACP